MLMMAGCGAGLAGSSSQALAKGKQRDFNSVAAKNSKNFTKGEKLADASWTGRKYVHSFDARNGEMIPGKDFDGYLKFPNLKKASSRPKVLATIYLVELSQIGRSIPQNQAQFYISIPIKTRAISGFITRMRLITTIRI